MIGTNSSSQIIVSAALNSAPPDHDRHDWNNPARMPTRFGVGLMLLFLTLFSVAFCILKACGTPPTAILFLTLLFTVVGFAQILWPGQPRLVSALSGGMYLPLWSLAFVASQVASDGDWQVLVQAAPMAFCIAPMGALFGYLAGALLAGIFLRVGFSSEPTGTPDAVVIAELVAPAAPAAPE